MVERAILDKRVDVVVVPFIVVVIVVETLLGASWTVGTVADNTLHIETAEVEEEEEEAVAETKYFEELAPVRPYPDIVTMPPPAAEREWVERDTTLKTDVKTIVDSPRPRLGSCGWMMKSPSGRAGRRHTICWVPVPVAKLEEAVMMGHR